MSRFHTAAILAALLGALAIWRHQFTFLSLLFLAFLILMGLGVARPGMKFFGNFICSGNRAKPQVALTFDDGPDENSTPQLLDLLREKKFPPRFFASAKTWRKIPSWHPEFCTKVICWKIILSRTAISSIFTVEKN